MSNEENEITTEYSSKSEFCKAAIADFSVRKIIDLRSKEMKEGYFNEQVTSKGEVVRTYVEDTRKTFINGVEALKSLLTPEIRSNKELITFVKKIEEEDQKLFEKYSIKQWREEKGKLKPFGEKYIPEVDDSIMVKNYPNPGPRFIPVKGYWNSRVSTYWWNRLKLYDSLFSELNVLTAKINYFKSSANF